MAILGLVLTGGGARAAYQVGVLKALAEMLPEQPHPFQVIAGSSAGAINCARLAVGADDFPGAVRSLEETWQSLTLDTIYRTDAPSLLSIALRWLGALAGGGHTTDGTAITHLLDTEPLRRLLDRDLPFDGLANHFQSGVLRGLALSATNYLTGTAITFFDGAPDIAPWVRSTRLGRRVRLTVDHVMASAAIPLFFPPVPIDGVFHGDGSVRLAAPLSPAIHLGAERILAIGVRYFRSQEETAELNRQKPQEPPTFAEISGVLLNAVFLDALEGDMERLQRINRTLALIPVEHLHRVPHELRPIPALLLRPSQDLGLLASGQYDRFPAFLRYLLSGLGATDSRGADLLSYLAFERDYIQTLIELGERDTLARADEIRAWAFD
jgi:NTE family protein